MKIDNLLKQLGGSCLVVSILTFFANCALAEEHRGPSHDKHGKPEAHSSGSSHQKRLFFLDVGSLEQDE